MGWDNGTGAPKPQSAWAVRKTKHTNLILFSKPLTFTAKTKSNSINKHILNGLQDSYKADGMKDREVWLAKVQCVLRGLRRKFQVFACKSVLFPRKSKWTESTSPKFIE